MVVTVPVVRVMQAPIHEITNVIAMRHRFMTATGTVNVFGIMTQGIAADLSATIRVGRGHLNRMFIDMILMRMMKTPIMQIVDMVTMAHRRMTAIRSMHVRMVSVFRVRAGHRDSPFDLSAHTSNQEDANMFGLERDDLYQPSR